MTYYIEMMVKLTRKATGNLVLLIEVGMHRTECISLDVTPGQRHHTLSLFACHIQPPFCLSQINS